MIMWRGYDRNVVKSICTNCDSEESKKTYSYLEYMQHVLAPSKIVCEIYDNRGFYFATLGKSHARLIEIAVRKDAQGSGLGKKMLYRLLSQLKARGIYKLTFRTPIDESAQFFWAHMGAVTTGLKDNDFLMEINFK